jgi:SAM-dependent methyltransferase
MTVVHEKRVRRNWLRAGALALLAARPCVVCGGRPRPAGASWMHAHLRCTRCGLIYVADLPTRHNLEAAYQRVHEADYQVDHKADWRPWVRHKHATLDALGLEAPGVADRALELGCGEGRMLVVLDERGWRCQGIEPNPVFAAEARALGLSRGAPLNERPFDIAEASLEGVALDDEACDLVVMNHLIEHLRRPLAALDRVRGCLRPGGQLIVETPLSPDFENIDHLFCFSAAALEQALMRSGFVPRAWYDYIDDNYHHHNLACRATLAASGA